ncbi:MAG: phosphopantothenoylcysteine decarboxylase [Candidatus Omnitrophica bacterium]|nr:phosphopantothenoylcysteine decarboxylase [Candidatus Omnitrophota bacterium]
MRSNIGTVLITAGPTRERIDPVRFISNYSTGTFGYEIAREAKRRGKRVVLISGPTSLKAPSGVKVINAESASEMLKAVMKNLASAECVIMAAAVSDWRVRREAGSKIKRRGGAMRLELVENPDILREAGRKKHGTLVGFALETEGLEKNAARKLKEKRLDLIVANRLSSKNDVFGPGRVDVVIMDRLGNKTIVRRKTKKNLAKMVVDKALNFNI